MKYLHWLVILILLFLRIFFYYRTQPHFPDGTILRIKSIVLSEPVRFENTQYFRLKGFKIYLPKYPEVGYRDIITIEGEVKGDRLINSKIISISESKGLLVNLRRKLLHFYQSSLPYKHAGLVAGVVLGSKEAIDRDFWNKLKSSGTVHVVVASGMNVSIVAKFLISFLAVFLSRRKAIPFALIGIWSYSILSGFDAPIVRASIMGSITFTAQELGKLYSAGRTLLITVIFMILAKPEWVSDLGFWLSFIATSSILLMEEPIRKVFRKVPEILLGDLSSSLSAQIGVAPLLFASFGQFNVLSPLYNLAVLWAIPIITMIGMIAGIISLVYVPLARIVIFLIYPFTSWFIFCTTGSL